MSEIIRDRKMSKVPSTQRIIFEILSNFDVVAKFLECFLKKNPLPSEVLTIWSEAVAVSLETSMRARENNFFNSSVYEKNQLIIEFVLDSLLSGNHIKIARDLLMAVSRNKSILWINVFEVIGEKLFEYNNKFKLTADDYNAILNSKNGNVLKRYLCDRGILWDSLLKYKTAIEKPPAIARNARNKSKNNAVEGSSSKAQFNDIFQSKQLSQPECDVINIDDSD